jgi:tRNA G37 N-methylase Trm5
MPPKRKPKATGKPRPSRMAKRNADTIIKNAMASSCATRKPRSDDTTSLTASAKRNTSRDLNAWSVEGVRRAAAMNGWKCAVNGDHIADTKVVVYNEDNGKAGSRLGAAAVKVKHVNLGLLPSSRDSWGIAASILNDRGGWIHVHGNCKDSEIGIPRKSL